MNLPNFRIPQTLLALLGVAFLFAGPLRADDAASLFKAKCAVCHGADSSGNTTMGKQMQTPDLRSEEVQKQADAQLNDSITNGKGKKMPAYKDKLTDDQIKQLVGYIRELAKKK